MQTFDKDTSGVPDRSRSPRTAPVFRAVPSRAAGSAPSTAG